MGGEEVVAGGFAEGGDGGMFEAAFHGDGVEVFAERIEAADDLNAIGGADVLFNGRRGEEEAGASAAEGLDEGAVFEFAHDVGADGEGFKPLVELATGRRLGQGQQQGRFVKRLGKTTTVAGGEIMASKDGEAAGPKQVVEDAATIRGGDGGFGEDDIEAVFTKVGEESVG